MARPRTVLPLSVGAMTVALIAAGATAGSTAASAATYSVTTLADSGAGSLRAAIQSANAGASGSVIDFQVAGRIQLLSALPTVATDVDIDATTAPGYSAAPVVELDSNGQSGLVFGSAAGGAALYGLAVTNAAGDGVTLQGSAITLNKNYLGLDPTGAAAGNAGDGLELASGSTGNLIGLNPSGASGVVGNVISGNGGSGIRLYKSTGNTVVANRIGTDPSGQDAIPNGIDGITLQLDSSGNTIGGTEYTDSATGDVNDPTGDKGTVTPVFVVPPLGNLVSGNAGNGITITNGAQENMLNGNFVGTTADGDSALGNAGHGVLIDGADNNTLQGCKFVDNPFVYYNVLSANGKNGLRITDSDGTVVQANFFGIGANNTTMLGNGKNGILVNGTSADTQVGGVIPLGNVSAGNDLNGIAVKGEASGFTTFNTFGGLLAFKGAAPNAKNGLLVTATGGDILVRTNVLSGNDGNGAKIAGKATDVTVDPNILGLNTRGTGLLSNGGNGLLVTDKAHHNTIGGNRQSVIRQNTFSGNDGWGLAITGKAHHNQVFNTYVGSTIQGTRDGGTYPRVGNAKGGILVAGKAKKNRIGYSGNKTSKLVSGNDGPGVVLRSDTRNNKVVRNYIGLDRRGKCLANEGRPLVDKGSGNTTKGNSVCR